MPVGLDLVDIARIRRIADRHPGFVTRTFTADELGVAHGLAGARRDEFLAGRFAVKEAVLKALGVGLSGDVALTDIEVGVTPGGAPTLTLTGAALRLASARGLTRYDTSISHDAGIAAAVVLLS